MRLAIVFGLGSVAVPLGIGAVVIVHPTGSSWIIEGLVMVAAAALLGGVGAGLSVGRGSILIGWLVMLAGLALGVGGLAILGHPTDTLLWLAGALMSIGFAAGRGIWWLVPLAGPPTNGPPDTRGRGRFWDGTGWG